MKYFNELFNLAFDEEQDENIYLGKGWYIREYSIAWYIVRSLQAFGLVLAMALPYVLAIVIAGCLGF